MEKFHLLYTDKNGKFKNEEKSFENFAECEKWLEEIKAKYWEIGFIDRDLKSAFQEAMKN
jgi:hypothetical protein